MTTAAYLDEDIAACVVDGVGGAGDDTDVAGGLGRELLGVEDKPKGLPVLKRPCHREP
jgi:hypothetical protein